MTIKAVIRSATPPVIWAALAKLKGPQPVAPPGGFEGPYPSWEAAADQCTGWDSPAITAKTLASALAVQRGEGAFEQDGRVRESILHSETILAFLMILLSRTPERLNLIDFGGGLATNYLQNRRVLSYLNSTSIHWNIVERPAIVKLGRTHFQTDAVKFFDTMTAALKESVDGLIFTGSLQTISDPFEPILDAIDSGISVIGIDRVLNSPIDNHQVYVQRPDPELYYKAAYPSRCFSRKRLISWFEEHGLHLVETFTPDPNKHMQHSGFIFARR